ncbi:MAG: redoxin domain-containing protein [Bacteroidales bacterium]|nr:redoxin domain-containing protein [Bacteroidales bacterium]
MQKKFILFILLVSMFPFCTHQEPLVTSTISGQLTALTGQWLYLEELEVHTTVPLDSVKISGNGSFQFEIQLNGTGFYVLKTGQDNHLILLIEEGKNIEIKSNYPAFTNGYDVIGSKGTELLKSFEWHMQKQKERVDSLATAYYVSKGMENYLETKNLLDSIYLTIIDNQKKYITNFVQTHTSSLASLIVINRKIGLTNIINEEDDFSMLFKLDSVLSAKYPQNKHVLNHHKRVKDIRTRIFDNYLAEQKLKAGKKAPDIVLNDTSGHPVSLKMYTGKPVIVYFWAGWSARSREDNRRLVKMYDQLTEKGIQILGVSLDENEVVWRGAMKLDELPWVQVSDLKGLYSKIKSGYNVPDELPFYYLLDKELRIEYKNNRLDSILVKLETLSLSD